MIFLNFAFLFTNMFLLFRIRYVTFAKTRLNVSSRVRKSVPHVITRNVAIFCIVKSLKLRSHIANFLLKSDCNNRHLTHARLSAHLARKSLNIFRCQTTVARKNKTYILRPVALPIFPTVFDIIKQSRSASAVTLCVYPLILFLHLRVS